MNMKNIKLLVAALGIVGSIAFPGTRAQAQLKEGEIVNYAVFEKSIPWDLGQNNYTAILYFIQTPENKDPDMCDLVRVSFSRSLKSWDKDPSGNRREIKYKQKWAVDIDTLETVTKKSKYKVYVDGIYVRDSIVEKKSYRLRGALLGRFYDYTDLDDKPLADKTEDHNFNKNSYMPVNQELYEAVKGLTDEWPIVNKVEEESDFLGFNNIYLSGPQKEFDLKVAGGKTGKVIVGKDFMTVNIYDKGKIVDSVTFKEGDEATLRTVIDSYKTVWGAIYPSDDRKSPWKIKYLNNSLVLNTNSENQYTIDGNIITETISLAKKRSIILDPPSSFDYFWF